MQLFIDPFDRLLQLSAELSDLPRYTPPPADDWLDELEEGRIDQRKEGMKDESL